MHYAARDLKQTFSRSSKHIFSSFLFPIISRMPRCCTDTELYVLYRSYIYICIQCSADGRMWAPSGSKHSFRQKDGKETAHLCTLHFESIFLSFLFCFSTESVFDPLRSFFPAGSVQNRPIHFLKCQVVYIARKTGIFETKDYFFLLWKKVV